MPVVGRADPWVRGVIAVTLAGMVLVDHGWVQPSPIAAMVGAVGFYAFIAIAVGWVGGESVLVPGCLALMASSLASLARGYAYEPEVVLMLVLNGVVSPIASLGVMAALRLGRNELRTLGVTTWAPGDLALVPVGVACWTYVAAVVYTVLGPGANTRLEWVVSRAKVLHWWPLVVTVLFGLALRHLVRLLRKP